MNTIDEALDNLRQFGWCKGSLYQGRSACMTGAIFRTNLDDPTVVLRTVADTIQELYPGKVSRNWGALGTIAGFNDLPHTEWSDVEAILEKASLRYDEEGRRFHQEELDECTG